VAFKKTTGGGVVYVVLASFTGFIADFSFELFVSCLNFCCTKFSLVY